MKIVDVEPIIEKLYKIGYEKDELGEHEFALGIDTVIYLLEQAKEVEAEPIKRGKWIRVNDEFSQCSLCKYPVHTSWGETNYCPNCGAKMAGE